MANIRIDTAVSWYANPNLLQVLENIPEEELDRFRKEVSRSTSDISLVFDGKILDSVNYDHKSETHGTLGTKLLRLGGFSDGRLLEYHGCVLILTPEKIQADIKYILRKYFSLLDRYDVQKEHQESPANCV